MTSFALLSMVACGAVDVPPGTGGAAGAPARDAGVIKDGGGASCRPLPGCNMTSDTTCFDGCNNCSCSNGLWRCTLRACPPDAGKCTYDDPTKTYVSKDPAQCRVILYACPTGTTPFTDSCGCGCQRARCDIPECFRAVNCVAECGGPILSSSCCPCPKGTFDNITCGSGTQ
ncbi:MAG TPA: hypothetical protein VK524_14520 [Polyangiaceae bacterium]|nr:hypothetical protein [Polyangiaceae bacterium]